MASMTSINFEQLLLPICVLLAFVWLIIAACRAHLPAEGTIEWIERECSSVKYKIPKAALSWKAVIVAFICLVIAFEVKFCFGDFALTFDALIASVLYAIVCVCAYFAAFFCSGKVFPAFVSSVVCVALGLHFGDIGFAAAALYVMFVFIAVSRPLFSLAGGVFLGIAAYFAFGNTALVVFGLLSALTACFVSKKASHIVYFVLFEVVLPAAVYTGLCFALDGKFIFPELALAVSFPPYIVFAYAVLAIVVLVFALIYKDLAGIVIFEGVVVSIAAKILGLTNEVVTISLLPCLFTSIISVRGKKRHNAASVVFAVVFFAVIVLELLNVLSFEGLADLTSIFYN